MTKAVARKPGRPLGFDREAALQRAMLLFWRHGYEATSVSELVQAMGITPPSLYTAFGDKKGLFREAVRRYVSGPFTSEILIDGAGTSMEAAAALLQAAARGFTTEGTPAGCLLASATASVSAAASDVQDEVAEIRRGIERRLRDKIQTDVDTGILPAQTDADAWAGHVMAVIQGMSTLARDGASRTKLVAIANAAVGGWERP